MTDPEAVIASLGLVPHPEGGWFKETWRASSEGGARSSGTAIFYLLRAGEHSRWHRIDATEIWHFYAGAPLALSVSDGETVTEVRLGGAVAAEELPQFIVPPTWWQSAVSTGEWTLVGCTVSPGFEFAGFELAEADFEPRRDQA